MEKIRNLPAGPSLYREVQRVRRPWLVLLVLALAALIWYSAWQQLLQGRPDRDLTPGPGWTKARR